MALEKMENVPLLKENLGVVDAKNPDENAGSLQGRSVKKERDNELALVLGMLSAATASGTCTLIDSLVAGKTNSLLGVATTSMTALFLGTLSIGLFIGATSALGYHEMLESLEKKENP